MKKILLLLGIFGLSWNVSAFEFGQVQIHGFVSQGYLQSDTYEYAFANTEDGTVEFNEFGINFASQVSDRIYAGIQLVSRDFGQFGNNDVTIDWAFGDYRYRNWLGFRAGKMKRPVGLSNKFRDIDAARTSIFLPPSIYPENVRTTQASTTGVGVYGFLPAGFEYEVQVGTVDIEADSALVRGLDQIFRTPTQRVDVADDTYIIALTWNTPLEGLRLVGNILGNYSWTHYTAAGAIDFESNPFTISAEYSYGDLTAAAEYRQRKTDIKIPGQPFPNPTAELYYGMLNYRFSEWFELGSYYSVSYGDKDDKEGKSYEARGLPAATAWLKDLAITARVDINESWLVKLEGHWFNGLDGVSGGIGEDPDEDWFLFAAKVTFSF